MFKLIAVACVAFAFATPSAAQSVIDKAKAQEQKQQQQKQQQQKAQEQQAGANKAQEAPHMKKARANCNAKADGKKLKGEARKRYMDDCVKT